MKGRMPDRRKAETALIMIVLGVGIRVALAGYPNIEPVLAIAMMAGLLLGGAYALLIPLVIMMLSDAAIYAMKYGQMFGWKVIIGISFFTWTGMMMAGFVGTRFGPQYLCRTRNMAVFTGTAVVVTLLYDLWTVLGTILLIPWADPGRILLAQAPFSMYHILSTLVFVPLFGTGYMYLRDYLAPALEKHTASAPDDTGSAA